MIQNIIHRLMEHAKRKAKIQDNLDAKSDIFAEHVCKIVYYEPTDVSWYDSVMKSIKPAFKRLKSDHNKQLSVKDFKEYLWDPNFESIEDFKIFLEYEFEPAVEKSPNMEYLHRKDLSPEEAYKKISAFGNALFREYSTKGRFPNERCTELCQEYLEK